MIKLTPVTMTKRELNQAVLDGRRFTLENTYVHEKDVIHWDDKGTDYPVRKGIQPWNWRGFKYLHEITESHWYDDPNAIGMPVMVRDFATQDWELDFFDSYNSAIGIFKCKGDRWKFCEILTAADIYQEPV